MLRARKRTRAVTAGKWVEYPPKQREGESGTFHGIRRPVFPGRRGVS